MINFISNNISLIRYDFSIIIYYDSSKYTFEKILNRFTELYSNINFEVIILSDKNYEYFDLNSYNFSIKMYDFSNSLLNLNYKYNFLIMKALGEYILFQYSYNYHLTNLLNEINKDDLLDNIIPINTIKAQNNNDNNNFLNNNLKYLDFQKKFKYNFINSEQILKASNDKYLYFLNGLFIHRKNIDILEGFKNIDNLSLNDLINRSNEFFGIKFNSSVIISLYDEQIPKINESNIIKLDIIPSEENIIYKKLDYSVGVAISIYSDETSPEDRIETSKICLKSIIEKLEGIIIIIVIDGNILDHHYKFLIDLTKNYNNVEIYKNINNFGIAKTKNICMKLLEQKNIDFICLLDDDIEILQNFIEYIKDVFINTNIPIIANIDERFKKENNVNNKNIKNFKFYSTSKYLFYGNIICFNKYYIKKFGYFHQYPYFYSVDHVELTERYWSNSRYSHLCLCLKKYINNEQIINNKSQIFVHSRTINRAQTKLNNPILYRSLKNIKYVPFELNIDEIIKIK